MSMFQRNRKLMSTTVALNKASTGSLNFQPTQTKRNLRIFQHCQNQGIIYSSHCQFEGTCHDLVLTENLFTSSPKKKAS